MRLCGYELSVGPGVVEVAVEISTPKSDSTRSSQLHCVKVECDSRRGAAKYLIRKWRLLETRPSPSRNRLRESGRVDELVEMNT